VRLFGGTVELIGSARGAFWWNDGVDQLGVSSFLVERWS
jgi:hypothetical protein